MKAVPADAVFFIVCIGDAEHIGLGGHGLMEGGIENRHLGNLLPEGRGGRVDALDMGGIMQRGQGSVPFDIP